jgi:hypothetical protein
MWLQRQKLSRFVGLARETFLGPKLYRCGFVPANCEAAKLPCYGKPQGSDHWPATQPRSDFKLSQRALGFYTCEDVCGPKQCCVTVALLESS